MSDTTYKKCNRCESFWVTSQDKFCPLCGVLKPYKRTRVAEYLWCILGDISKGIVENISLIISLFIVMIAMIAIVAIISIPVELLRYIKPEILSWWAWKIVFIPVLILTSIFSLLLTFSLADKLSDKLVKRIEARVIRRVFNPCLEDQKDY